MHLLRPRSGTSESSALRKHAPRGLLCCAWLGLAVCFSCTPDSWSQPSLSDGGDVSASLDASLVALDAGRRDAASDARVESGPAVDGGCPSCRECRQAADCAGKPGGRTHCSSAGSCVVCETNAECTSPGAAHCSANVCTGCSSAQDCTRFSSTPLCVMPGMCVACASGADCKTAEAPVCDQNSCRACKAVTL